MFLRVVQGKQQGLSIPLDASGSLLIGRKRANLVLDDPLVSGQHCRVFARGEEFVVEDLGSTNGTLVDGRLVREEVLQPGAEIAIGNTRLVLLFDTHQILEPREFVSFSSLYRLAHHYSFH